MLQAQSGLRACLAFVEHKVGQRCVGVEDVDAASIVCPIASLQCQACTTPASVAPAGCVLTCHGTCRTSDMVSQSSGAAAVIPCQGPDGWLPDRYE